MSKRALPLRANAPAYCLIFGILQAITAQAQDASDVANPAIGSLIMPSATPQQAEQYLSSRSIPITTTVSGAGSTDNVPPTKLNIAATLGHDLPESETTQYGFKRADFATASSSQSDAAKKRQSQALGAASLAQRPATAILTEEPPSLGGAQQ